MESNLEAGGNVREQGLSRNTPLFHPNLYFLHSVAYLRLAHPFSVNKIEYSLSLNSQGQLLNSIKINYNTTSKLQHLHFHNKVKV